MPARVQERRIWFKKNIWHHFFRILQCSCRSSQHLMPLKPRSQLCPFTWQLKTADGLLDPWLGFCIGSRNLNKFVVWLVFNGLFRRIVTWIDFNSNDLMCKGLETPAPKLWNSDGKRWLPQLWKPFEWFYFVDTTCSNELAFSMEFNGFLIFHQETIQPELK